MYCCMARTCAGIRHDEEAPQLSRSQEMLSQEIQDQYRLIGTLEEHMTKRTKPEKPIPADQMSRCEPTFGEFDGDPALPLGLIVQVTVALVCHRETPLHLLRLCERTDHLRPRGHRTYRAVLVPDQARPAHRDAHRRADGFFDYGDADAWPRDLERMHRHWDESA